MALRRHHTPQKHFAAGRSGHSQISGPIDFCGGGMPAGLPPLKRSIHIVGLRPFLKDGEMARKRAQARRDPGQGDGGCLARRKKRSNGSSVPPWAWTSDARSIFWRDARGRRDGRGFLGASQVRRLRVTPLPAALGGGELVAWRAGTGNISRGLGTLAKAPIGWVAAGTAEAYGRSTAPSTRRQRSSKSRWTRASRPWVRFRTCSQL